jgi:hypothetical protein
MTVSSGSNATTFSATSGTKTITTATRVVNFPIIFNGVGGTFQLVDNYTGSSSTSSITLTAGTLDLNAQTVTAYSFSSSGSLTRSLVTTGATINLFGNNTIVWNIQSINVTLTSNTIINLTYTGATGSRTIITNSLTEATSPSFVIQAGSDTIDITGNIKDLTFVAFSGTLAINSRTIYGNFTLSPTMTITSVGSSTTIFAATSGVQTITTNGRAFPLSLIINAPGATVRLADNLDCSTGANDTRRLTLTAGT